MGIQGCAGVHRGIQGYQKVCKGVKVFTECKTLSGRLNGLCALLARIYTWDWPATRVDELSVYF